LDFKHVHDEVHDEGSDVARVRVGDRKAIEEKTGARSAYTCSTHRSSGSMEIRFHAEVHAGSCVAQRFVTLELMGGIGRSNRSYR
jgi:hypothetical protein